MAVVLLFHAGHLTGGYLGVDLFFVLSGFLITSLLLSERSATGRIDLLAFWGRRVRRLLPGLLLLLLGIAAYAAVIARPIDLDSIRADSLTALLYVANWHTIFEGSSYWEQSVAPSPLQHVWSLAIEEQFYLLWPLLVVAITRRRRDPARMVWLVSIDLALASVLAFIVLYQMGASDTRIYVGTDTRAAAILVGASLAAWRAWHRPTGRRESLEILTGTSRDWWTEVSGLVAVAGLGVLWVTLDGTSTHFYQGGLFAASLLGMWIIAVVSRPGSTLIGQGLSVAPLQFLGRISYGLYLWHWPIFLAIDQRNGRLPFLGDRFLHEPWLFILKVGLSVALATASYHLVEMPVRHGFISRRFVPSISFGAVAIAMVLVFVSTMGGVPILDPTESDTRAEVVVEDVPRMVIAGDSVALSVAVQVAADPASFDVNPVNRALAGCSVAFAGRPVQRWDGSDDPPAPCADPVLADVDAIAPDLVFLMTGSRPNDATEIDGQFVQACDPRFDEQYAQDLTSLVENLRASGALVALGTTLYSSANAFVVEGSEERITCVNQVIEQVADTVPGTFVVDVNDFLCPDGTCVETIGDDPVRSDGLHFDDGPGGVAVSRWIVDQSLQATGVAAPGG